VCQAVAQLIREWILALLKSSLGCPENLGSFGASTRAHPGCRSAEASLSVPPPGHEPLRTERVRTQGAGGACAVGVIVGPRMLS
jgi:hypothetical protein